MKDLRYITITNKVVSNGSRCSDNLYKRALAKAMQCGYLLLPDAINEDSIGWLELQTINPNSTFYKTWEDITSKSRFELLIDQLIHYQSTYGTDFMGETFVPNDNPPIIPYRNYKLIKADTKENIWEDLIGMTYSGVALSSTTQEIILNFSSEYDCKPIIDKIKNKEIQAIFAVKYNIMPTDEFGLLRVIHYLCLGSSMIVKNKDTFNAIKSNLQYDEKKSKYINTILYNNAKKLSKIFYRYKPIFLALKNNYTSKSINKIRTLARTNHTPMKPGFWETLFSTKPDMSEVKQKLIELNNFRKVRLLQGIKERIGANFIDGKMFVIRNGKIYVRKDYAAPCDFTYLMELYTVIVNDLTKLLTKKATKIYMPSYLDVACPSSEKTFVGNYPSGTSISLSDSNNVFGIYWKNEWGCHDYDLHYFDDNGVNYGWNSHYSNDNNTIIYSGDITNADPEACELIHIEKQAPQGIISLNKYRGDEHSKFKFFVAHCEYNSIDYNDDHVKCMVDPNNIVFQSEFEHNTYGELKLATIVDNRLYLTIFDSGNRRVNNVELDDIIKEQLKIKSKSIISLNAILKQSGFTFVDSVEEADLDFTNISKTDIIKLFS